MSKLHPGNSDRLLCPVWALKYYFGADEELTLFISYTNQLSVINKNVLSCLAATINLAYIMPELFSQPHGI